MKIISVCISNEINCKLRTMCGQVNESDENKNKKHYSSITDLVRQAVRHQIIEDFKKLTVKKPCIPKTKISKIKIKHVKITEDDRIRNILKNMPSKPKLRDDKIRNVIKEMSTRSTPIREIFK